MDQWKVEQAGKQFQAAYRIRLIDRDEKEPSSAIYVFRDRLGSAVANRFRGNTDSADEAAKPWPGRFAAIEQAERGPDMPATIDLHALHVQLARTLEAGGDCELYGGSAGNGKVNLTQAADNYEQASQIADNSASATAIGYKLAIVARSSVGRPRAAEGRQWP